MTPPGPGCGELSTAPAPDSRVAEAIRTRPPLRRRPGPGLLVALSGMDGAGKSSAIDAIVAGLRERDIPVKVNWHRLGETTPLDRLAAPVKRILRPRRPVSGRRRRGPIAWAWIVVVALVTVRSQLISSGLTRRGIAVVCDRWTTDALVDLAVRYGRHRVAERLLRVATPRADVALLLEIDPDTAAARKPGDQPLEVLRRMEALYAAAARRTGPRRIDAARPQDEVVAEVLAAVESVLPPRG
jgi:thymidylate kinase